MLHINGNDGCLQHLYISYAVAIMQMKQESRNLFALNSMRIKTTKNCFYKKMLGESLANIFLIDSEFFFAILTHRQYYMHVNDSILNTMPINQFMYIEMFAK